MGPSRLAARSNGGFQVRLPAGLTPAKIGAAAVVLIVGLLAIDFLWSWKTERAQRNAEKKQAEMAANFDYIRFDNEPAAIDKAFKLMPAKFNVKPPELEVFKAELSAELSKKNHDNYISRQRQNGTYERKQQLMPTYNQGTVTHMGSGSGGTMTTGGPGPTSVTVQMKRFEEVQTKYANKYLVTDLSVADYNYVKAQGDKLVCFVKYSAKLGQFQTSNTVQPYNPVQPRQAENTNLGTKIKDWTVSENALYEYENNKWVLKEMGISDLDKLGRIDELKASAQAPIQTAAAK